MKQSFVAGLLGSLIGVAAMLLVLTSAGLVGAQGPSEPASAGDSQGVTVEQQALLPTAGGGPNTPVGTVFSYQGQLKIDGAPFTGNCDMKFALWNGSVNAGVLITTVFATPSPMAVASGLFVAYVDFGDQFKGDYRAIQPQVRCPAGSGSYVNLPDQVIYPAPYALSLRPGATISSNLSTNLFSLINTGNAPAAYFEANSSSETLGVINKGSGEGVVASSQNNLGVLGLSINSHGIYGAALGSGGSGLVGYHGNITGTALNLMRGGLRVQGAGVNTATPVFIHQVDLDPGGNSCGGFATVIDNPLINGRADAILIITPNEGTWSGGVTPPAHPVAVTYDAANACGFGAGRWVIWEVTFANLVDNQKFNVLAVLP